MKKIGIGLLLILLLVGCGQDKTKTPNNNSNNDIVKEEAKEEPKDNYVDDNPIKLGFYLYQNKNTPRHLITNYSNNWLFENDIGSFEVFLTQEQEIDSGYFQNTWKKYYDNYENIDNYRLGYHIYFQTEDGTTIDKNLLKPEDGDDFYDYIQIYMYDDVHKEIGQWYSHVTPEEYNDSTLLSSIKLTGSTYIDKVKSPIKLTAFSYDSEDDFKNNKYRGNSSYTITIDKKN